MPRFSIIVALYNQADKLPLLIEALNGQTFNDFEVHFCDDGSTDGTAELLESNHPCKFQYHYHKQENSRSYAKAMNMGVAGAQGEYCLFIAGDSFPEQDYLEILNEYVRPERMVCGIRIQVHEGKGVDMDWRLKKELIPEFPTILPVQPWIRFTGNGLTIPTAALRRYGPWCEDFVGYGGEDNELVARLYFKGLVCWSVPDLQLYHHWHRSRPDDGLNSSKKAAAMIKSYAN